LANKTKKTKRKLEPQRKISILASMNKNQIKEYYVNGALRVLLEYQVEHLFPIDVSPKAIEVKAAFMANLARQLAEIEKGAEEYSSQAATS
jgi:hypothetical protein